MWYQHILYITITFELTIDVEKTLIFQKDQNSKRKIFSCTHVDDICKG